MESISETKEKIPELKFAHIAPDVWSVLHDLKRTGWVNRGVVNPESVQEHTVTLRVIASNLEGLSESEQDGLLDMLEVHDWPEAIHGDEVVLTLDVDELKKVKGTKFENEKKALETICSKLGDDGKAIINLWVRFETSEDDAAIFARQLDKYQAVEKALQYEKEQGIPMFKEFLDHVRARGSVTHPVLLRKIEELELKA